jgi:hypothetical protein
MWALTCPLNKVTWRAAKSARKSSPAINPASARDPGGFNFFLQAELNG